MKKKVVLVISSLQGNGAERFVLTLAKGLQGYGCEAHIVYFRNKIDLPIPNAVKLHYFNYNKFKIIPKFMRQKFIAPYLDKFILNNIGKADLILSNLYPIDGVLAHSQLNNVHLVIHNTTSQEYAGKLNPKFINLLKRIYLQKPCVGVSEGVTQDFKQLFGEQSQITTIYNPIDVDEVRKTADEYVPAYQDYIVHVGKFKQQKRHDILIRAYAKANVSQKLVLVGTGGLMEASKQLVKDLNIENKVIFAGFQKNPYPFIKHAKFMVLSSDFEGLGLVILEALALDTPVISTDCPSGPREVLKEHQLVAVGDVDGLTEKIRLASVDSKQYAQPLREEFLIPYAVEKYLNLVEEK